MGTRSAIRGVRCALAGLMLAAGAMAFESLATPVTGHKGWSASGDNLLSEDSARSEKYLQQADGWWSLP